MAKRRSQDNISLYRQIAPLKLNKGELRKLQIVEAAIECMATLGYEKTNYETVGKICKMKRPHVAYHFPKWPVLIEAALNYVYATGQSVVVDFLKEASSPKDRLKRYIEGTYSWFESHPNHGAVLTLFTHLGAVHEKYRKRGAEFKRLGVERVHAILKPGSPVKHSGPSYVTSRSIHDLLVGGCLEWVSCERKTNLKAQVDHTYKAALRLAKWK